VNFIKSRLKALEESRHGRCPECYQKPKTVLAYYPEQGESPPEVPTCPSCGRSLAHVIQVVHDDEGGGATADA
jgi:hypothetical protein